MQESAEKKGCIFNIQRYSIHDGPGIRTTVFLKGCPLRCFWCQNPESQKLLPDLFLYADRCTGCGLCVSACKTGAASIIDNVSAIDRDRCIVCGKCAEVCPNEAREVIGYEVTVDEVMAEVLRDKAFYKNSGGGVTLSGGDPTFQPEFSLEIFRRCKEEGLHTVLETCGCASWSTLEKLLEYVDFVLFDIKMVRADKHVTGTGVMNDVILENAKKVAACRPVMVRVPLIPGFNDSESDIRDIVDFVRANMGETEIELLRYNKLGECKNNYLDREPVHLTEQTEEYFEKLKSIARAE